MTRVRRQRSAVRLAVVAFAAASPGCGPAATPETGADRTGWVGSETCRTCHEGQHESWARTFHRTMTQEATPASVLGAFDGRVLDWLGARARPVRHGDSFFVEYLHENGAVRNTLQIARTVGSRRYQQYLASAAPHENDPNLYRIPLVWHIDEQRWGHLNGAFLEPDGLSYDHHVTIWNQNCVFCHNTGPVPGLANAGELAARKSAGEPVRFDWDGRYDTHVAELGIACEACHSPGAAHVARYESAWRRALGRIRGDGTEIVQPEDLDASASVQLCGQCHGQRLPDPPELVLTFLTDGPPYRAGDDLSQSVAPITRETPFPGEDPDGFRARFWNDGTPRLTAYEYQGLVSSACHMQGGLTCIGCHSMHGGDPRGQIEPLMRTNAACVSCHDDIARDVTAHTHHAADGAGSSCYECHMPRAVFGVLEIHRSHRIEAPDPAANARDERPDACTSCHLDRSRSWAIEWTQTWWSGGDVTEPKSATEVPALDTSAFAEALFGGDPVERAVAARLASRPDAPLTGAQRATVTRLLIEALADGYPGVRHLAARSLAEFGVEAAASFDPLASSEERTRFAEDLEVVHEGIPTRPSPGFAAWFDESGTVDADAIAVRRAQQPNRAIHIGE